MGARPPCDPLRGAGDRPHGGPGRGAGARGRGRGPHGWPPRAPDAPRAGHTCLDGTAGARGGGLAGLTTDAQSGTPAHGCHRHRRDVAANPLQAVVVRPWQGRDDGPGGQTVWLPQAAVPQPWPPCADDAARRRIEPYGITAAKPPWDLDHPPQKTARAVQVHGMCTCWMCALATAYRLPCAPTQRRAAPGGWQRWRRQRLEQTRDQSIVVAQRCDGLCHLAACALLVGGKRTDVPPGIGTRQEGLATYRLTGHE